MFPENLEPTEIRVIACLVEKEYSTPDNYPLSLNALTNACNQSSNRDPVMSLSEGTVSQALDSLRRRGLVRSIQGIGSRVPKFQHLLNEFGFSRGELAALCVLMLRGPQTQAEVRSRGSRLMPNDDATGLDAALDGLVMREGGAVVARLERQPGQKEARYAHLLAGNVVESAAAAELTDAPEVPRADRLAALEEEVGELKRVVEELRTQLAVFRRQFE